MNAPAVDAGWAVRVPTGYRVGGWEVTAPIATGNFGSVYAARRAGPGPAGDPVALKFIATGPAGRRTHVAELAGREVAFSRRARHENLIAVTGALVVDDPGRSFDGAVVLVMERAERSVQDLLDAAPPGVPLPGAGRLLTQVCAGLAYLHGAGWVHGDLKPSNILVMADSSVRLADFGLVTPLDGTHGYGPPLGSTDYQPPERWSGGLDERGVQVRPGTDVWALGITAYQLVTGGDFPFPGGTPGARVAAAHEFAAGRAPLRLSGELDPGWRDFVRRCLDPDPATRSPVPDLLDRARRLADRTGPAPARRRWHRAVAAGLPVAVLGAGAAWWATGRGEPPPAPVRAQVTVHNAEVPCQPRRTRPCSLGLAVDPRRTYDAANVSAHRVWHGDRLVADCVVYGGARVADENGVGSTTWYRVAVPQEPTGHAWLPAVRTLDVPALPGCPR